LLITTGLVFQVITLEHVCDLAPLTNGGGDNGKPVDRITRLAAESGSQSSALSYHDNDIDEALNTAKT